MREYIKTSEALDLLQRLSDEESKNCFDYCANNPGGAWNDERRRESMIIQAAFCRVAAGLGDLARCEK